MTTTHLEKRWGGGGVNPNEKELRAALAELTTPDEEHPDCWLTADDGWTISAHESGKVVFQNLESGDGPWHMVNQKPEDMLILWRLLQAGDIEAIHAKPWLKGHGGKA